MSNSDKPSRAQGRPKRIPIGTRNVLTYPPIPGYVTRVVNDVEDRIQRFKEAGYEVVQREEVGLGDPACGVSGSTGSEVSKPVGAGRRGVLMKIKEEYYKEDQAAKQAQVDAGEEGLWRQAREAGLTNKLGNDQLPGIQITRGKG